jgi:hypothetical protein
MLRVSLLRGAGHRVENLGIEDVACIILIIECWLGVNFLSGLPSQCFEKSKYVGFDKIKRKEREQNCSV